MKVTALWLYEKWDDVVELERGEELFIDPVKVGRSAITVVQGVNRILASLAKDKLVKRIEWKVSVIDGIYKKYGLIVNPVQNVQLLKKKRAELFLKAENKFIKERKRIVPALLLGSLKP